MTISSRSIVFWFGAPPTAEEKAEFWNRNLAIRTPDPTDQVDLNIARAIVFCARPPYIRDASSRIELVLEALNHGLLVYLIAQDEAAQDHISGLVPATVKASRLEDHLRRRTGELAPYECAETIARHDPGPSADHTLKIFTPPGVTLTPDQEFLIRRAFNDCADLTIEPLAGGKSATAFSVQAKLRASEVGPRPLPFFMKLDEPGKIYTEQLGYQVFAAQHIPWYLRPNLDPRRCMTGINHGILVGSFVGQSESLWEAVLDGRGPRYIHALFEETLMGWRSQGYRRSPEKGRVASAMKSAFTYTKVKQENVDNAATFGAVTDPKNLWETLLGLKEQSWRHAPMHGDLHGENVRVRNGDAIIIDLARVGFGPLSADIANLEVWIAFEIPPPPREIPDRGVWTELVGSLYSPREVGHPPHLASSEVGIDWLRACVRQTRMLGNSICECTTEYATAVAIHLLRRACYRDQFPNDPARNEEEGYRRAYAYYLGSKLVESLASTNPHPTRAI